MVRTQIYLTEEERAGLDAVAKSTDKTQSEIVREAVDRFLDLTRGNCRKVILDKVAGLWRNRKDLPDFAAVRRSLDRG
ncbi:MAG: ribbon-helix-helix domain-containing protein [Verrucomicrobia bacterium]|nr:ribbon-helix-helix domain-containing protein [Verrucomicrobiota bacterium]MBU4292005.1 ribbon-helix-helix domain-containing protein [Verrucomicrobiota bacterium]MBU4427893.1 ribbon-helix-helix domain-containing protein [Verrucomicrobiota bacterium]MCG2678839.1 ribbon-helix-helix domain-containing protein [Kiritimatiellia bacterium]